MKRQIIYAVKEIQNIKIYNGTYMKGSRLVLYDNHNMSLDLQI